MTETNRHIRQVLAQAAGKLQRLIPVLERDERELAESKTPAAQACTEGRRRLAAIRGHLERLQAQIRAAAAKHESDTKRKQ